MRVAIVDALTGQVVRDGPISSAKVEVVVLEGDFHGNVRDNWTQEEFMSYLVREREGKKALLSGDAVIYLEEGIGSLGVLSFTDNSSWTRSRKFRLGAIILDNSDGIRVKEAKTDSFTVRDHRGECESFTISSSYITNVRTILIAVGTLELFVNVIQLMCSVQEALSPIFV